MVRIAFVLVLAGIVALTASFRPGSSPSVDATAADCSSFSLQVAAQIVLMANPADPNQLDGPDDDGIACEDLPCPCNLEPVTEAIGDGAVLVAATDTPVPTQVPPTATPEPPTPTPNVQLPADTPTVVIAPPPTVAAASTNQITPPSTGDAGLLR